MAEATELAPQQLEEHQQQLAQVDELLTQQPGDAELLGLRKDLLKVLGMSQDLTTVGSTAVGGGAEEMHKWSTGERCTALWEDGKWYHARVDTVADDDQYTVTYLDFGNTSVIPESSLKPFQPAPKDYLKKGQPVRAIFEDDGLFYDAVVHDKASTPGKFSIRFPKFGKKKYEVNAYDLVKRPGRREVDPNEPLPDKPVIPEQLKYSATDTDAQKDAKRRRIKRIKSDHRKLKLEEAGKRKQNSWMKFQKGGKFGRGAKKRKSIFASTIKGVVGVCGSGKDMTAIPERSKHRFRQEDGLMMPEE